MAVTKIKPVKTTLNKAISYILNPDKTDGKMLASSFACAYETADIEFAFTLSQAMVKGNNLAHHLIQSFEPGETTPEQAHEIGRRLADEILGGKYEYVLTTHIDKGHIHNHLMFCAASFIDHHKYVSNKKSYAAIRAASDRLCGEFGLSIIAPGQNRGKHYAEYAADKAGGSWKSKLKTAIDTTIVQSKDFKDFLRRMEAAGYEIKRGKYISFHAVGQERFTRAKTLGVDYAEDAIVARISGEYVSTSKGARPEKPASLLIDIESNVKAQQSAGFAKWAKIQNLKEAAKTLNFLTENNLLQYGDLEAKAAEVAAAFDDTADALKATEKKLTEMAVMMKHVKTYRQTKPVFDGLKSARDKAGYLREHESEIILHEAAARALRAARPNGGKLPSLANLQAEHKKLTGRKNALNGDYAKLKKQAREIGVIKSNVDSILNPNAEREKTKTRNVGL